jgi:hypothetical protein
MFVCSVCLIECHFCNKAFMALLLHLDFSLYALCYMSPDYVSLLFQLPFGAIFEAIRGYFCWDLNPKKVSNNIFPGLNATFECLCPRRMKTPTNFREKLILLVSQEMTRL